MKTNTTHTHYFAADASGHKNLIVRQRGHVSAASARRIAERHAATRGAVVKSVDFVGREILKNPAAVALGRLSSEVKADASRRNGRKGGRPADPFKAALRAAGVKWAWTKNGLKFYLRTSQPRRMRDGSFWKGTETIGFYESWQKAKTCTWLASHAK